MLAAVAIVVLAVSSAVWLAEWRQWPWAEPALHRLDRVRAWVIAYVALSPATFIYLFVLVVTSWVLRSSTAVTSQSLLATHSTNLHNLRADPVGVLVTSAFWLDSPQLGSWALLFGAVMAPAERWLGSLRMVVAFATGHVVATLVTAWALDRDLFGLSGDDAGRRAVDVGVSYGFWCIAALFTYRLPWRWRWIWAGAVTAFVVVPFLTERSFTSFGHVIATGVGFALYPVTRWSVVRARRALPIWRPPAPAVEAARQSMNARRQARRPG